MGNGGGNGCFFPAASLPPMNGAGRYPYIAIFFTASPLGSTTTVVHCNRVKLTRDTYFRCGAGVNLLYTLTHPSDDKNATTKILKNVCITTNNQVKAVSCGCPMSPARALFGTHPPSGLTLGCTFIGTGSGVCSTASGPQGIALPACVPQ